MQAAAANMLKDTWLQMRSPYKQSQAMNKQAFSDNVLKDGSATGPMIHGLCALSACQPEHLHNRLTGSSHTSKTLFNNQTVGNDIAGRL